MFVSSIVPYRDHIPVRKQTTAVDMLEEYLAGGNVDGYLADLKSVGFSGFSCSDMQAVILLTCLAYLKSDKPFYYELIMQIAPFYCGRLHEERYNTAFPIFSRNFFDAMERNTCMARDCLALRATEFLAARHDRVRASHDHFAKQDFKRVLRLLLPPIDCKKSAFADTIAKSLAEWRKAYNPEIVAILLLLDGFSKCLQINNRDLCKLYVQHESSDYYKTAITVEVEGFHGTLAQAKNGQNVDDVVDYVAALFFQGIAGRNFCNLKDKFHDGLVLLLSFCYQNTKDSTYLELLYFVIPYIIAYDRDEALEHLKALPNLELAAESIKQWIAAYNPVPLEIVEIVQDFSAHFSTSSCDLLCEVAKTTCKPSKVLKALLAFRRVHMEDLDEQEKRVVVALCQNPLSDSKVLGKCQKVACEIDITIAARTVDCKLPAAVDKLLDRVEVLSDRRLMQNALVSFADNVMAAGLCQEATDLLAKRNTLVLMLYCACMENRTHSSLAVCSQAVRSDYFNEAIRNELVSSFKEKGFMAHALLFQKRDLSYDELSVQFSELGIKKSTRRNRKKDLLPLSRAALHNTQRPTMEQKAVEIVKTIFGDTYFAHERLSPGCSGSVIMRVTSTKRDVVVRFWNMQWKEYFAQDLDCHKVASAAGYGPKLFFDDKDKGITVMQYVKPLSPYCKKEQLKALSELLIKIHKGPKVPSGIDRRLYLDTLLDEASTNPYGIDVEALRVIKNDVFDCTRKNATVVACHRDLHPGNLLFSNTGYLAIDYTWGAMDDLFADLANIAIFHCSTPDEEMLLLQNYFGRMPSEQECARLALMKLPAKMFYGLEFLSLSGPSLLAPPQTFACYQNFGKHGQLTEKADFLAYSLTLLNEVREFASCNEYKQALHHCK